MTGRPPFPDGAIGVFPPLVPVAVRFPENGVFGKGPGIEAFPGQKRNGGFPGIVLGEKLGEGNEGPAEHRGHGADHSLIQGLLLLPSIRLGLSQSMESLY